MSSITSRSNLVCSQVNPSKLPKCPDLVKYKGISTIGLDFDGTCVEHRYPNIGQNAPRVIEALQYFNATRRKLYLFTLRGYEHLDAAINWFNDNGIILSGVHQIPGQKNWTDSPKPAVDMFIDNRSFGAPLILPIGFMSPVINWLTILDQFKQADATALSSTDNLNLFRH